MLGFAGGVQITLPKEGARQPVVTPKPLYPLTRSLCPFPAYNPPEIYFPGGSHAILIVSQIPSVPDGCRINSVRFCIKIHRF